MFASLFELFFKYRPVVFQEGDFQFGATPALYVAIALAVAGAVAAVVSYTRITTQGGGATVPSCWSCAWASSP